MASHANIVKDILNGGRIVNREEKMSATLDVMRSNIDKKAAQHGRKAREIDEAAIRGYGTGTGRRQGD